MFDATLSASFGHAFAAMTSSGSAAGARLVLDVPWTRTAFVGFGPQIHAACHVTSVTINIPWHSGSAIFYSAGSTRGR